MAMTGIRAILRRLIRAPQRRQVAAAVPVRPRAAGGLEFLLVRTVDGVRWTFPKGGREPGETLAEAAAREAIEEAGAAGRVGAEPITSYRYGADTIAAFLLEVGHTSAPLEPERNPTWCGFEDARSKLAERRDDASGEELERVLHAAARAAVR
jgi:8-oxo-dGTP pyrophosphatase MutT (NUDIX family)